LLLIVAAGATYYSGEHLLIALTADHRTAPGEVRTVTLSDGSTADLNTASAIKLRFTDGERRVELLAGEALFSVASAKDDEQRPFTVVTLGGTTRALGTRFLVHRSGNHVTVTDIEHRIEVSVTQTGSGRLEKVVLDPGQAVEYSTASGLGSVVKLDVERAAAWQRGRLLFDRVSLENVIAELNRYRRGTIIVANRDLARRQVSGVFRLDDLDGALNTIVTELGARSAGVPPFMTVIY
jgi:transmembrane sensor